MPLSLFSIWTCRLSKPHMAWEWTEFTAITQLLLSHFSSSSKVPLCMSPWEIFFGSFALPFSIFLVYFFHPVPASLKRGLTAFRWLTFPYCSPSSFATGHKCREKCTCKLALRTRPLLVLFSRTPKKTHPFGSPWLNSVGSDILVKFYHSFSECNAMQCWIPMPRVPFWSLLVNHHWRYWDFFDTEVNLLISQKPAGLSNFHDAAEKLCSYS